jgi:hypothetical protein
MQRSFALVLTIVLFFFFLLICYHCLSLAWWSSIVLSVLLSFVILNAIYPLSKAASEEADFSLVLYITIQILFVLVLVVYIFHKTLFDKRSSCVTLQ